LLPPGLVMAVLDVESGFDRWAVSSAGAVGLMQVMPFWPERLACALRAHTRDANLGMAAPSCVTTSTTNGAIQASTGALQRQRRPPRLPGSRHRRWTTY